MEDVREARNLIRMRVTTLLGGLDLLADGAAESQSKKPNRNEVRSWLPPETAD